MAAQSRVKSQDFFGRVAASKKKTRLQYCTEGRPINKLIKSKAYCWVTSKCDLPSAIYHLAGFENRFDRRTSVWHQLHWDKSGNSECPGIPVELKQEFPNVDQTCEKSLWKVLLLMHECVFLAWAQSVNIDLVLMKYSQEFTLPFNEYRIQFILPSICIVDAEYNLSFVFLRVGITTGFHDHLYLKTFWSTAIFEEMYINNVYPEVIFQGMTLWKLSQLGETQFGDPARSSQCFHCPNRLITTSSHPSWMMLIMPLKMMMLMWIFLELLKVSSNPRNGKTFHSMTLAWVQQVIGRACSRCSFVLSFLCANCS